MACHTERGQAAGAGGRAFQTPFGKVYSSNITPDVQQGLGAWDANDFWRAMHHGKSKDGRLLTPVFPYQHTTLIAREDSDAMFAALKTWTPAANPKSIAKPSATLDWPYGTPLAIAVWRSLFFTPGIYVSDPQQSKEWNRGAYLAQGLGHCAACHSERNDWGAIAAVNDFSGGRMPIINWYAPSLTSLKETGLAQQSNSRHCQTSSIGHGLTKPVQWALWQKWFNTAHNIGAMKIFWQWQLTSRTWPNKNLNAPPLRQLGNASRPAQALRPKS
jgi:mono/diheme cytochrome c family protein